MIGSDCLSDWELTAGTILDALVTGAVPDAFRLQGVSDLAASMFDHEEQSCRARFRLGRAYPSLVPEAERCQRLLSKVIRHGPRLTEGITVIIPPLGFSVFFLTRLLNSVR